MAHFLIWTKRLIKTLAVVVSIAFLINSMNGIISSIQLADGETIQQTPIEQGDFEVNWQNKSINIGISFNNSMIYDIENIVIHLRVLLEVNGTTNHTIMDLFSNGVAIGDDVGGTTIKSGENKEIRINATGEQYFEDITPLLLTINPSLDLSNWDLKDLLTSGLNFTTFKVHTLIDFSFDYAFKQFQVDVQLLIPPTKFLEGML